MVNKPIREYDPTFVSCAPSPADAKAVLVRLDPSGKYHTIKVSCPFCGKYHLHSGGEANKPVVYGFHKSHCQKGSYTILPVV